MYFLLLQSAEVDLALDGVKFTAASFVPDAAHITSHADISTKKGYAAYATTFTSSTTLSISGLRLQARDISFVPLRAIPAHGC